MRRHVDHARYRVESSPSREDDARSRVESFPSREDDDGWETVGVASDTTQQDIDDVDQSQQEDRSVQGTQPPTDQLIDGQIATVLKDCFSTHPRITNSNEQTLFL